MKRKYSTLFLDVDGTLLNFDEAERRGVRAVMESQGVTPTKELAERYHQINLDCWRAFERDEIPREAIFQKRYPQFFAELGLSVDAKTAEELYRQELDSCALLLPHALEICAYLKERYDLYVTTNGVSSTQYARLRASGLDRYFSAIFVSEDAGSQKPQREYFDYCFARVPEKDPARILIIGDSLTSDIRGGKNAGIDTCLVKWEPVSDSDRGMADYVVCGLLGLKEFL